ncbi:MAG: protein kinase, partial [Gemmatimonadota bacterium]
MSEPDRRGMIERLNAALEGRYRIDGELGEGGMATVFLAHDLRHDRKVALKVLRPELAAVVGGERFLAEIRTTANLQHPHILPLYDSGEADTFLFYVMPYVEGESLREKLDRERQLPVEEAVRIARAVAGGLDYAHRQGVVHRDIKPANILLQDGEPLVADFGIALAIQQAGGGRLTETGLSLGTPYYMSPEQATAERDPDARSDVYSLGCVLYEMLTGEPPFPGNTAQAVLGKILTGEAIPPTRLRKTVPPGLEAATLRALARVPADRFSSASEFAQALAAPESIRVGSGTGRSARGDKDAVRTRNRAWVPWALAGLAAVLFVALLGALSRSADRTPPSRVVRASLQLPEDGAVFGARVAISRDGSVVAVGATVQGRRVILARPLDQDRFSVIEGTDGADQHFLSPDGRSVAFRSGVGLRRAPISGGRPVTLDPEDGWSGGDWFDDGTIVYSRSYRSGLWRLTPGGEPERLSEPSGNELAHWWPQRLPDGEHILFTAFGTPIEESRLAVLSVETGERKDVLGGAVHGRYVKTGHLLFARGEAIYAVPFDLASLEVRGEPTLVVDDVAMEHASGLAAYDVSEDGTLVYVPASEANAPADLVWVDREGRETPVVTEPGRYENPALSPDGRSLAVTISGSGQAADLWVLDLERETRFHLADGGGIEFQPVWTLDGRRVIYGSERPVFDLYWRPADGSAPA